MCSCVPCKVLRQCSATNPADIIIYVPSMTVLGFKKNPILYFMPILTLLFVRLCMCIIIILTPHEYYMVLPALAINAASKPRLAASALHTVSFI